MAKGYEKADPEVRGLLKRAIEKWHPELAEFKARVQVLMVSPELDGNDEPKAPALTGNGGHPALAKVRIAKPRDRLLAKYDVLIEIDAHAWADLIEAERLAVLDHELEHVVIARDSGGAEKFNDDKTIKLRTRRDDWCLTGFHAVASRQNEYALEVQAIKAITTEHQELFPFAKMAVA